MPRSFLFLAVLVRPMISVVALFLPTSSSEDHGDSPEQPSEAEPCQASVGQQVLLEPWFTLPSCHCVLPLGVPAARSL